MSDKLEALKHSVAMILRSMDKRNVHILEEAILRDATLESELALTKQKLEAAKQRELELLAVIEQKKSAAQKVVDRWETTYWKEIDPDSNLYLCTTRCPAIRTITSTPRTRSEDT